MITKCCISSALYVKNPEQKLTLFPLVNTFSVVRSSIGNKLLDKDIFGCDAKYGWYWVFYYMRPTQSTFVQSTVKGKRNQL